MRPGGGFGRSWYRGEAPMLVRSVKKSHRRARRAQEPSIIEEQLLDMPARRSSHAPKWKKEIATFPAGVRTHSEAGYETQPIAEQEYVAMQFGDETPEDVQFFDVDEGQKTSIPATLGPRQKRQRIAELKQAYESGNIGADDYAHLRRAVLDSPTKRKAPSRSKFSSVQGRKQRSKSDRLESRFQRRASEIKKRRAAEAERAMRIRTMRTPYSARPEEAALRGHPHQSAIRALMLESAQEDAMSVDVPARVPGDPFADFMFDEGADTFYTLKNPSVFGQARTNPMTAITAKFPGQHCVECGAEFTPGHSQIQVHPSIRGPKGGKKYVHANPAECGARHNPFGRRNPAKRMIGSAGKVPRNDAGIAGYHAAKGLLDHVPEDVIVQLTLREGLMRADQHGLTPRWIKGDEDEYVDFVSGFTETFPAVKAQARSMSQGFDSGDYMSRYNPAPRVFRNAGRRTFKGQPKAGRLERMGPVTGLPSMGTDAPYHDTDVRHMTKQQLVDSGAPWAAAELRRRGRDAQGVKLAWKK